MVVKKDVWERIPADVRPKLIAITQEYGKKIAAEVRRMDSEALSNMKAQGLVSVTPSDAAAFQKAAQATYKVVRGRVVPEGVFDEVQKLVADAHAKGKK
jgi:TRAP-type C4-dicarboxylate transport system substrate-binding protein